MGNLILKDKIAIWGAGGCGIRVLRMLRTYDVSDVVFVDVDLQKQETCIEGIYVMSPEKLWGSIEEGAIRTVIFAIQNKFLEKVTELFRNYPNISGYMVSPKIYWNSSFHIIEETLVAIDLSKPRLYQFQTPIANHCNMKCKGCLHHSNLIDDPEFAEFDSVIADWGKVKELFWGVYRLKILGGEPLLNHDLPRYVEKAREIFPDAEIMITTNGLLLDGRKDLSFLFNEMRKYGCYFDISVYAPLLPKLEKIENILKDNEVNYSLNMAKDDFYKILSLTPEYDKEEAHQRCLSRKCHHVDKGKIYACPRPAYLHVLNDKYNTHIPDDEGFYDLYEVNTDGWELKEKLDQGFETCKYCAIPVKYQWGIADSKNAKIEDWIVN